VPGVPVPQEPPNIGSCSGRAVARVAPAPAREESDAYVPPARIAAAPAPRIAPRPAIAMPPAPALAPRLPALPRRPPPPPPLSGWAAFLGAFASENEAASRLSAIGSLATKTRTLPVKVFDRPRDGRHLGVIYGLNDVQARAVCDVAKRVGQYCLTLSPAALLNPKARWRR